MSEPHQKRRKTLENVILQRSVNSEGRPQPAQTNGERALRLLMIPPMTENDQEDQILADEEQLVWKPCRSLVDEQLYEFLGEVDNSEECFGCNVGLSVDLPVHDDILNKLKDLMENTRQWCNEKHWAQNVYKMYEEEIRLPSLKNPDYRTHFPTWSMASIVAHSRYHIQTPEAILARDVQCLNNLQEELLTNGIYLKCMFDPSIRRVQTRRVQTLLSTIKTKHELMKQNPSRMFGYNVQVSMHRDMPYGNNKTIMNRPNFNSGSFQL